MTVSRLCQVGRVVDPYCLKVSENCLVCLFGKGCFVCGVGLRVRGFCLPVSEGCGVCRIGRIVEFVLS